jgi:hypothetical protein
MVFLPPFSRNSSKNFAERGIPQHQPTPNNRNQQQTLTTTPENQPSALDNRHLTTNNKQLPPTDTLDKENKRQPILMIFAVFVQILQDIFCFTSEDFSWVDLQPAWQTACQTCIEHGRHASNMADMHRTWQTYIEHGRHAWNMADMHRTWQTCIEHGIHASNMADMHRTCQTCIEHGRHPSNMADMHRTWQTCIEHGRQATNMTDMHRTWQKFSSTVDGYSHEGRLEARVAVRRAT